jgi:hypothetical protein
VTISISYAAAPNLARDEAVLTLFYAAVFAVPALMLRARDDRTYALGTVVIGGADLAVCAALALVMRAHPDIGLALLGSGVLLVFRRRNECAQHAAALASLRRRYARAGPSMTVLA